MPKSSHTIQLLALIFVLSTLVDAQISIGLGKKHVIPTYKNYNRRAAQMGVPSLPVGGNVWPVAIYWFFLQAGTPLQPYPVAIDTGSNTMDLIGPDCSTCITKPPNRIYDPTKSTTSKPITCSDDFCQLSSCTGQCTFSNTYQTCDLSNPDAPCTISGVWFTDLVTVDPSVKPVPINFGAIQFQTSNFNQFQNIDAIVGLIQSGPNDPTDVFLSLYEAGNVPQNIFAMCLLNQPGSGSNGTITFGGIDPTLYTGKIQWTSNTMSGNAYGMSLNSLTVFGTEISAVAADAILDSGTNVLLLPHDGYAAVEDVFFNACNSGANLVGICKIPRDKSLFAGNCFPMTPAQLAAFPNITLNIDNVAIVMPPSTYLNQNDPEFPDPTSFCLGIRDTGSDGFTIIGDTSMSNYYVIFDNENNRIGWADVNKKNCGAQPFGQL